MPRVEQINLEVPQGVGDPTDQEVGDAFDQALHQRIRLAAYYRALKRGFAPGKEMEDWSAAEAEERSRTESPRDE